MHQYSYGWEKLHLAVIALAGPGEQSERVRLAVIHNLLQVTPENDLPEDIQVDYERFIGLNSSADAQPDDRYDNMDSDKAIELIIGFYDSICRHLGPN